MDPSVDLIRGNRSFRWYWIGQSASFVGSHVAVLAFPLVTALALDAGPGEVGIVATAGSMPYLLFSLLAGNWLEGRDQRRVMIPADLIQAAVLSVVPIAWLGGWLSVPLLAGVAFVAGCGATIFGIAGFTYIPVLVPPDDLPAANRSLQGSRTLAQVGGPGLAGTLVSALGPALSVVVTAASFVVSAICLALGRAPRPAVPPPSPIEKKAPILDGLRIITDNPYLRALTMHAAVYNLASQVLMLNLVLWAVTTRGVSEYAYGLALGAAGLGALVGTALALVLADRVGFGRAFAASLVLSCFVPVVIALPQAGGTSLAVFIAAVMFVSGIGLGNANIYSVTLRQRVLPESQLARSAGAFTQVMYGAIPIGAALAGLIGDALGTRTGVALGTVGLALSALPMMTARMRRMTTPSKAPEQQNAPTQVDPLSPRRGEPMTTIANVTIHCRDAAQLARFWAEALGWDTHIEDGSASLNDPSGQNPTWYFENVEEVEIARGRWHLDLQGHDGAAREIEQLIEAGAKSVEIFSGWTVLEDPENNRFCVLH